ncbi:DNA repair protein RecN [Marinicella sediminis]|uniref:DNA repair protein RecN n=1 Tax=Marinicella sediminis TaxID=1792834 RepID=A0ABV7J6Q6_9GAMM|nr:DNA repair protein RecN [Marinicella sediminis]
MLQSLYIQNFVLIDQLEIDFHSGMSVFTGETGAGKSIIIGALSMALGNRADSQTIGPFAEHSEIIATFDVAQNPNARQWLQDQELGEDNELVLRRTFNQQGRSKQWINGRPMATGLVKDLSQYLVQIHGQHDQIRLLKPAMQLHILDLAGDHQLLLKQTRQAFDQLQTIEAEIQALQEAGSMSEEQVQLLNYQLAELDQLALGPTEYEQLHDELKTAAHARELMSSLDDSMQLISDSEHSVEQQLAQVISTLRNSRGHDFSEICQMLEESMINVAEASQQLQQVADGIVDDPAHLQELEQRIELISQVARKQQVMPELLHQHHQQLTDTLNTHADLSQQQVESGRQRQEALTNYRELAAKLSTQRQQTARTLATDITTMIQNLGLPEARFSIAINHQQENSPKASGNDQVEFMIAANKGQQAQALSKTASGGELSRISLAIEVSTQQKNQHQVFIFDEVDTGIGGATAEQVGHIMQQLSKQNQVFAVTHLPQVAGHAHDHLLVSKSSNRKHTTSKIEHLNENQRIEELARMSGGQTITEATLAQAREFLKTG